MSAGVVLDVLPIPFPRFRYYLYSIFGSYYKKKENLVPVGTGIVVSVGFLRKVTTILFPGFDGAFAEGGGRARSYNCKALLITWTLLLLLSTFFLNTFIKLSEEKIVIKTSPIASSTSYSWDEVTRVEVYATIYNGKERPYFKPHLIVAVKDGKKYDIWREVGSPSQAKILEVHEFIVKMRPDIPVVFRPLSSNELYALSYVDENEQAEITNIFSTFGRLK
ncbi:MAG: hypothetical protein JNK33_01620 [Candidatus Doudnabacteria bacterium]|nr:hypothetical protein [Candidatus Doudnabacteria bacterium]